eukprot:m.252517 g.252517  ORF g.252517 m.252517 type:complete len:307 (-) comp17848_c0_seq1:194-1114(-)
MPRSSALLYVLVLALAHVARAKLSATELVEAFTGRCVAYNFMHGTPYDCDALAGLLQTAVTVNSTNPYDPFVQAIVAYGPPATPGTALLWSGCGPASDTDDVVHRLSTSLPRSYTTLEDSFLGYGLNGLDWCEASDPHCTNSSMYSSPFWLVASDAFAGGVRTAVNVLLYGGVRNTSIFGSRELPTLPRNLTAFNLMVITNVTDGCGIGSYATLETYVRTNFPEAKFTCENNPAPVRYLLCAAGRDLALCAPPAGDSTGVSTPSAIGIAIGCLVLGVAIGAVAVYIGCMRRTKDSAITPLRTPIPR